MPTRLFAVTFDCTDHVAQARWWAEALGVPVAGEREDEAWLAPDDCPELIFVPVPEPKTSKNRFHFDLGADGDERQSEMVERLLDIGAKRIDIGQPDDAWWTVLADPESNEFCVLPSHDAYRGIGPIRAMGYDAFDADLLGNFWSEATGWEVLVRNDQTVAMRSPLRVGPILGFASGPGEVKPKLGKNRIHIDLAPSREDDHTLEVRWLESLGARRVDIGQGDVPWVVMADPEDNEFCVLTPR